MFGAMARTSTVSATGSSPDSLAPSNLLQTVVRGLYESANTTTQNFGFTIPQGAMVLGAVVFILLSWSLVASLRNRKNFSLEDDDDGEFPSGNDRLRGGLLRPESGPEGSKGALT